ncbi:MAG: serine/threonine-protein kinase [Chloroflexota bacterium]
MTDSLVADQLLRDRYIIRQIIGRGGMGSIYLAEDSRLPGRLCAVKEVKPEPGLPESIRAEGRDQFYREARVLALLDHPNLPKVSDFFSEGERDYLVMDYVPGEDLKSLMDQARRAGRRLPLDDVLRWALQLADALGYLHGQDPPVIHRDIKPSNLKITPNGLLKLVDFGLVKQMAPDEVTVTVIQGRGTAQYTPLEQYGGDAGHTDPRTDLYAFGATLYHLVTNQPPPEAKLRFLDPSVLRPPREFNPDLSTGLEHAILWAMALHPDDRPPNIAALRPLLEGTVTAPIIARRMSRVLPLSDWFPSRTESILAASAAVLLITAALATFL